MEAQTITVQTDGRRVTLRLTDKTDIWLDRSASRRKNAIATREDCRPGRRVEVMHTFEDKTVARWIKIAE